MNRSCLLKGYLMVIFSAVIFGSLPLFVKSIYAEGVNSLTLIFLRNLLSAPVAGLLAWHQYKRLRIPRETLASVGAIGIMGCCVAPLLLFSSYFFIASSTATVFHFVYPAAVVLGGVWCYREKITPAALLSVVLCVAGVCLFYTPGQPLDWRGSALALVSGVAYAVYILLLAHFRYRQEVPGFLLNFHIFLINAVVMLVVCLLTGTMALPGTLKGWLLCLFLAVLVNVCAVSMFQRGTLIIGGQQAAILSTMEPITSVFVGVLAFQEIMTGAGVVGSVLVILASVLTVLADTKKQRTRD